MHCPGRHSRKHRLTSGFGIDGISLCGGNRVRERLVIRLERSKLLQGYLCWTGASIVQLMLSFDTEIYCL